MTTIARATMILARALDMVTLDFVTNIDSFEIRKRAVLVGNRSIITWDVSVKLGYPETFDGKGPTISLSISDSILSCDLDNETWDEADTRAVQYCLRTLNLVKDRWKQTLSKLHGPLDFPMKVPI